MAKNLIITLDNDTNNIVASSKININNVCIPIDDYVCDEAYNFNIFGEGDVWAGMDAFNKN